MTLYMEIVGGVVVVVGGLALLALICMWAIDTLCDFFHVSAILEQFIFKRDKFEEWLKGRGTYVGMADGSIKAITDLQPGDELQVVNRDTYQTILIVEPKGERELTRDPVESEDDDEC